MVTDQLKIENPVTMATNFFPLKNFKYGVSI